MAPKHKLDTLTGTQSKLSFQGLFYLYVTVSLYNDFRNLL